MIAAGRISCWVLKPIESRAILFLGEVCLALMWGKAHSWTKGYSFDVGAGIALTHITIGYSLAVGLTHILDKVIAPHAWGYRRSQHHIE